MLLYAYPLVLSPRSISEEGLADLRLEYITQRADPLEVAAAVRRYAEDGRVVVVTTPDEPPWPSDSIEYWSVYRLGRVVPRGVRASLLTLWAMEADQCCSLDELDRWVAGVGDDAFVSVDDRGALLGAMEDHSQVIDAARQRAERYLEAKIRARWRAHSTGAGEV